MVVYNPSALKWLFVEAWFLRKGCIERPIGEAVLTGSMTNRDG